MKNNDIIGRPAVSLTSYQVGLVKILQLHQTENLVMINKCYNNNNAITKLY